MPVAVTCRSCGKAGLSVSYRVAISAAASLTDSTRRPGFGSTSASAESRRHGKGRLRLEQAFNERRCSGPRAPIGPHEIGRVIEMHIESTAIRALNRLANTPRQVNVGRRID